MKRTIIFSAFMTMLLSAVYTSAQPSLRLSFSEGTSPAGVPTGTVKFIVDGVPVMQVFEALIPVATEAACFDSRDFSTARPVGPDRASVTYDPATNSYQLKWTGVRDRRDTCRVLLVGGSIAATDLAVWQANYGTTALSNPTVRDDATYGRAVYRLFLEDSTTSSTLSVSYPNQDGELIEVGFPEAPNSNFRLLETSFPARSDAECLANRNFAAAVPVGNDRATIGYYPSGGVWYLRNSNASAPTVPCHALFVDGDDTVDARDYVAWRSRFGSSLFAEGEGFLNKDAGSDEQERRQQVVGDTVTYTFKVFTLP